MGTLGLVAAVSAASVRDRPGGMAVLARPAARFRSVALVWADDGHANCIDDGRSTWCSWSRRFPDSPLGSDQARRGLSRLLVMVVSEG